MPITLDSVEVEKCTIPFLKAKTLTQKMRYSTLLYYDYFLCKLDKTVYHFFSPQSLNPFLRSNGDLQEFKLRNHGSQVNDNSEKLFSDTVN